MRGDAGARQHLKALRKLLPAHKDDVAAVAELVRLGYPAVQPLVYDLLKWIRVDAWPVAKPITAFLVTIGPAIAPDVSKVLVSRDDLWKAVVLKTIVADWPTDAIQALSPHLFMIATNGQSWGADLLALRLLAGHALGDPAWIEGWLEFKREHHLTRLADIADLLRVSGATRD